MSSSRKIDIVQLSFEHGLKVGWASLRLRSIGFAGGTFIKTTRLHQARFSYARA